MGVESNIVEDSGILINHEVILQCSKKESPKGPVEFTSVTKIRKVCRSVLEVKGYKVFGDHRNSRYQLFAQLVVAMEKNMELTPLVKNTILGAFASGESVLFAKIDMDSTKENFCIRHTEIFAFRHKPGGSSIKVFNPENSKLVVELFFSMVMNDGKHRLISHSAMQTSIDKFRTESEANEFIRIGKIVHVQKMEQQLRESEEREEKRIQEVREYEERLKQEIKEREEKLSQEVREYEERLRQEIKEREEKLSQEREEKLSQKVRESEEHEEKRSQQLRENEERLRQEIKESEKRLRKEGEMREKKRIQDLQKENKEREEREAKLLQEIKEREERLRQEREESEVREARLRLKIQDLQLLNSSKKRRRRAQKLAGPKR
eukprot:gene34839-45071_t